MALDMMKVGLGVLLLVVSTVVLMWSGMVTANLPLLALAVASLAMAAGAVLVGTSDSGRPV